MLRANTSRSNQSRKISACEFRISVKARAYRGGKAVRPSQIDSCEELWDDDPSHREPMYQAPCRPIYSDDGWQITVSVEVGGHFLQCLGEVPSVQIKQGYERETIKMRVKILYNLDDEYLFLSLTRRANGTSPLPGAGVRARRPLLASSKEGAHQNREFSYRGRGWRSILVAPAL